jgi:hypothetical protein
MVPTDNGTPSTKSRAGTNEASGDDQRTMMAWDPAVTARAAGSLADTTMGEPSTESSKSVAPGGGKIRNTPSTSAGTLKCPRYSHNPPDRATEMFVRLAFARSLPASPVSFTIVADQSGSVERHSEPVRDKPIASRSKTAFESIESD